MADNTINVRIKDRSDTEANWTSKNPVLLKGERAITDGIGKYKIGDGKNTWSALPYYEAMTSADRTKLNGIASGANKTIVDSSLSSSSTNPVQNKVVNSALAGKSNTNHTHDLSTMINTLSTGGSTPTDDDYFVSQYVGGGTTTTTYHRRPVKALLEYIKKGLAKVATSGSYNDLSNKPTIPSVGNGTITIKQAGTVKGSFTTNQSGTTTIELTDNNTNTWRGIQNNLTSTSTTDSLSAAQGKVLNDKFASYVPTSRTVNGKALSANISLNASDVGASASGHTHTAINNGLTICGRTQNNGDDEGIVINKCSNNCAGLILGSPNGVRSVFYLTSDNSALWRYNNGSSSFDIGHPKKNGTVALTSDIPSKLPASDVYAWAKASTKPNYSKSEIGLGNVDNTADSAKSVKYATSAGSATSSAKLTNAGHIDSIDKLNNSSMEANTFKYATMAALSGLDGWDNNDGIVLSASWNSSANYGHQILLDDSSYNIAHRYRNNGTWSSWKRFLDTSNYNSYVPTKTGGGASGTWGINITGKATTAGTADVANSVAWGNVRGKPDTFTPSAHNHVVCQSSEPSSQNNGDIWFKEE